MTPQRRLEILTRTRALIADRHRWGKGTLQQHTIIDKLMMRPPSLCLMGAVMVAVTGRLDYSWEVYQTVDFLAELVPFKRSAHGNHVTAYNDRASTTHADVMFLLDTAIFYTETELAGAATQDEQHERHDGKDHQDRPQHVDGDTRTGRQ